MRDLKKQERTAIEAVARRFSATWEKSSDPPDAYIRVAGLYPAVDAADKESCRPDFAVAIYPGHLSLPAAERDAKQGAKKFVVRHPPNADKELAVNPEVPVTSQTPPTFLLQAEDDHVDNVNDSLAYYIALKNAGVPVEMHLYAQGGHAFGLRRTKFPITGWPQLVETWLGTIGMISD